MSRFTADRRFWAVSIAAAAAVLLSACTSSHDMPGMSGMNTASPGIGAPNSDMPGMDHSMPQGDGLTASVGGYTLSLATTSPVPDRPTLMRFRILAGGQPVTGFAADQTKLMHFYLIRSDLTGFQHVHPQMADDGTWTAPLDALQAGGYRVYASFVPAVDPMRTTLVLAVPVTVAGAARSQPLPRASGLATVDGYTLTVTGRVTAGRESALAVTFAKGGSPVTNLQPYLDTYAHLTAIHAGDLRFAHLHPVEAISGAGGGPNLVFDALLPTPGDWRLFLQFQTGGTVHTAALTLTAGR